MRIRFPVTACLVLLVTICCRGGMFLHSVFPKHASSQLHGKVVDGYLGQEHPLNSIYKEVSNYHDGSVKWFRNEFGACPGNHRLIEHGSALGEEISQEEERRLREAMRGSKHFQKKYKEKTGRTFTKAEEDKIIIRCKVHRKRESQSRLKRIMKMGYSEKDARLILRDASNTHFLGDLTSDNSKKYVSIVKPVDRILKEKEEFVKKFCSPKEYKKFKRKLKRMQAIKNPQKRADAAERSQKKLGKGIGSNGRAQKQALLSRMSGKRLPHRVSRRYSSRVLSRRALSLKRALAIRAGISRVGGGIGSAAMIAAPSLGGFRVGKTTMDVAVDASVMLAGYSASRTTSAMIGGTIGTGGAFAVAIAVQTIIAKIAYGFYERYQKVRREQRDIGVLKARIDLLRRDDGLLDRMVERAIEQKVDIN